MVGYPHLTFLLLHLKLRLHAQHIGYKFCRLDGSTKQSDRMPLIDQFNHDPTVFAFLISTLAGGTGLNLTGANKVVIFGQISGIPHLRI